MPESKDTDDSRTWELADRCLLPVAFSHALAVILATCLNVLGISQISSFVLFLVFLSVSVGVTLFYHNLKVTRKFSQAHFLPPQQLCPFVTIRVLTVPAADVNQTKHNSAISFRDLKFQLNLTLELYQRDKFAHFLKLKGL